MNETKFKLGDMVWYGGVGFDEPKRIIKIEFSENQEAPLYYLSGYGLVREESLRTKEDQIIALQALLVEFIKGED